MPAIASTYITRDYAIFFDVFGRKDSFIPV
jgi:hypothetical protein